MIWLGGWRQRSRRRGLTWETPPREAQRLVLDIALCGYPDQFTLPELADELRIERGDLRAALVLAAAVRDLAAAGLLHGNGVFVAPTRAALHFERLVVSR